MVQQQTHLKNEKYHDYEYELTHSINVIPHGNGETGKNRPKKVKDLEENFLLNWSLVPQNSFHRDQAQH